MCLSGNLQVHLGSRPSISPDRHRLDDYYLLVDRRNSIVISNILSVVELQCRRCFDPVTSHANGPDVCLQQGCTAPWQIITDVI